jgi:hypothetical protein
MFIYASYSLSSLKTLEAAESWIRKNRGYFNIAPALSNATSMTEIINSTKSIGALGYGFIVRATAKCDALDRLARAQSITGDTIYIVRTKRIPFGGLEVEIVKEFKI